MNAQELRRHIAATFPAFATKANAEFDKKRLELALSMIDMLHQLVKPDYSNPDQLITSRVIMDALKQHGHDYTTILSAKGGLELLIERGAST